jgi:hypothetical protein
VRNPSQQDSASRRYGENLNSKLGARIRAIFSHGLLLHSLMLLALTPSLVRPDAAFGYLDAPRAPAGIDYAEPLKKGDLMISYRYEHILLDGNREGRNRLTADEVNEKYPIYTDVPTEQEIDIHTITGQWAPFSRLTLAVAVPILVQQMKQIDYDNAGRSYMTSSKGVGDLELVGLVPFIKKGDESLDLMFGFTIPTGGIDEKDRNGDLLPFPMQPDGSSWNILTGLTYKGFHKGFGWGVQGQGEITFGSNDRGYRLGNMIEVNGWLGQKINNWLSGTVRMGYDHWSSMHGETYSGPQSHSASYASNSGGDRIAIGPGLSVALPLLGVQRLSIEALWPVYQSLSGPQLEGDWSLATGWEWIF